MNVFHCESCGNLLFFENTACVNCGHTVAFLPDIREVQSLEAETDGTWTLASAGASPMRYRLCRNYVEAKVCNWAVLAEQGQEYCPSCRLTEVIPDISQPEAPEHWYRLEVAKRRLVYTLQALQLPIANRADDPAGGLSFHFMADPPPGDPAPAVLTGHNEGIITINIAEADDAERERRRKAMNEPYRTLLGHMRHEVGHYYWDRLVRDTSELDAFRRGFGDERRDYGEALQQHYANGAPGDWPTRFISAYASAHPWEDWAETWAHYLHMYDTLETAAACGVSLRPRRRDEPSLSKVPDTSRTIPFDKLIDSWFPLTYLLNNLNRGMGLPDAYPFVLPTPAIEKLRFVHDVIDRFTP
ncbi:MAG: putative zinc-binding peptidase [Acidobacteriota bacterium]